LATLEVGDRLDCFGPLGNGFDHSGTQRDVAIVAGGVGIASVLLSAQLLVARGARVRLFYGARSADRLVEAQRFADAGCDVRVATDDGSAGHRGVVTELLAETTDAPELILACGPTPMLRAVGRIAAQRNIPAQLSLEETFACGLGGCWGCTVPLAATSAQAPNFPPTANGVVNARICKEGPVFLASELRW
jgi:dihydroorotate dehydrogenase electron transfer subunit